MFNLSKEYLAQIINEWDLTWRILVIEEEEVVDEKQFGIPPSTKKEIKCVNNLIDDSCPSA